MKAILTSIIVAALCTGCATAPADQTDLTRARVGAVGDAVSTQIALSAGAVESNPLLGSHPSPAALVAVTGAKLLLIEAYKDDPAATRTLSSLFNGLTVSNLMVAAGAATGFGVIAGTMVGVGLWADSTDRAKSTTLPKTATQPIQGK